MEFRASVAHDIAYAGRVNHRSVVERICKGDPTLHIASSQSIAYANHVFAVGTVEQPCISY